jgi:hypothetical protein
VNKELIFKIGFDSITDFKSFEKLITNNHYYRIEKSIFSINLLKNIVEYNKTKFCNDIIYNYFDRIDSNPIFKTANITMNFDDINVLIFNSLKKQKIEISKIMLYDSFSYSENKLYFSSFEDFNEFYKKENKIKKLKAFVYE